jgi:cell division protein FtsI (penicillin-binding protein 3)
LVKEEQSSQWVSTKSTPGGVAISSRPVAYELVPNVVGMGLMDALFLMESTGLKVLVEGRGTVRKQSITPGSQVRKGTSVRLNMSIKEG